MARRMRGNSHVRCRAGEKAEITSNPYLSLLFGNDAKFIAEAFDYMLKHYPFFNSVNFAVLDNSLTKYNYKSFSAKFNNSILNY